MAGMPHRVIPVIGSNKEVLCMHHSLHQLKKMKTAKVNIVLYIGDYVPRINDENFFSMFLVRDIRNIDNFLCGTYIDNYMVKQEVNNTENHFYRGRQ